MAKPLTFETSIQYNPPVYPGAQETLTMKPRILIVDDDDAITQQLFWTLCDDYDVMTANDMPTAISPAHHAMWKASTCTRMAT